MMSGNRFLLSTFDGSLTFAAEIWVKNLEAFFLLHPVVDKKVVEIAALHLEGEANIWWIGHLSHARVSTLAEFSQRMNKIFGKRREEPSPPVDGACTNTIETMEEQPSSSTVWEAKTYEEETLAALQGASKFPQGMIKNPSLVILVNTLDGSTSLHTVELEHQNSTTLYKRNDE